MGCACASGMGVSKLSPGVENSLGPQHWWAFPFPSEKDAVRWATTARWRTTMMTDANHGDPWQQVGTQKKNATICTRDSVSSCQQGHRDYDEIWKFYRWSQTQDSVVDAWFLTTPPRLHVSDPFRHDCMFSDLIPATVVKWLRTKHLLRNSGPGFDSRHENFQISSETCA